MNDCVLFYSVNGNISEENIFLQKLQLKHEGWLFLCGNSDFSFRNLIERELLRSDITSLSLRLSFFNIWATNFDCAQVNQIKYDPMSSQFFKQRPLLSSKNGRSEKNTLRCELELNFISQGYFKVKLIF